MSSCGTHATHIAVLWVKITCSICYDRADDSSIHRGTYHILKSTYSTTRSASLSMALVSPPPFYQGQGKMSLPLSTYPLLGWLVRDSFQKRVLFAKIGNRKIENRKILFSKRSKWSPRVKRWRAVEGILIFWRKECLLLEFWTPLSPQVLSSQTIV